MPVTGGVCQVTSMLSLANGWYWLSASCSPEDESDLPPYSFIILIEWRGKG